MRVLIIIIERVGPYANNVNVSLPLSYHNAFFDDFLHFAFTERLDASFVNYSHDPQKKHEHFYRATHEFDFYTDLSKAYDYFFHTLNLGVSYILPGGKSGGISEDYLNLEKIDEKLSPYLVQYFYNENGEKKLKNRIEVSYLSRRDEFEESKNLITYYYNENISFNNEAIYSHLDTRFSNVLSQIELGLNPELNWEFSHAYQNDEYGKYSFIGTRANYYLNANYNFFSGIWLDTQRAHANMWELGYTYQRKCWNYSLMYKERIVSESLQVLVLVLEIKADFILYLIFIRLEAWVMILPCKKMKTKFKEKACLIYLKILKNYYQTIKEI